MNNLSIWHSFLVYRNKKGCIYIYIYRNKLRELYIITLGKGLSSKISRGGHLVQLLVHLLLFVVAVVVAAGVLVDADGRLDRIVAQEHFCVLVHVIEASGFRPVQPSKRKKEKCINKICKQRGLSCIRNNSDVMK